MDGIVATNTELQHFSFYRFVLVNLDQVQLIWPVTECSDPLSTKPPRVFRHLQDLLFGINAQFNASIHLMKHHLEPPFVFGPRQNELRTLFRHYLGFFNAADKRSVQRNYCVEIIDDIPPRDVYTQASPQTEPAKRTYHLTFVEKALLCVLACFGSDYLVGVRPGVREVLQFPARLRNWLSSCQVLVSGRRCNFMPKWDDTTSKRQSIYSGILDFDSHHAAFTPDGAQPKDPWKLSETERKQTVLLYFAVMCNEILREESVHKQQRLGHLRYALDCYQTGDSRMRDADFPEFWRHEHETLVNDVLHPPGARSLRPVVVRLMTRVASINKFLKSGESDYNTRMCQHYENHVVKLIGQIPTATRLIADVSDLFIASNDPAAAAKDHKLTPLDLYESTFMSGEAMCSILMAAHELKLVHELDYKLLRPRNTAGGSSARRASKTKDLSITTPCYAQDYCYVLLEHQNAARVEAYYKRWLELLKWSVVPGENFWVHDIQSDTSDSTRTCIVMPKHYLNVCNSLSLALLVNRNCHATSDYEWQGPPLSFSFLLTSLVNPARGHMGVQCKTGESVRPLILFLHTLLIGDVSSLPGRPSDIRFIDEHSVKVEKFIDWLCRRTYEDELKRTRPVIEFYKRAGEGMSSSCCYSFGLIRDMLLKLLLFPALEFSISKENDEELDKFKQGVGLKEYQDRRHLPLDERYTKGVALANRLRIKTHCQSFQHECAPNHVSGGDDRILTQEDKEGMLQLIMGMISDASETCLYHPDLVFAILSWATPRVRCSEYVFNQMFDKQEGPVIVDCLKYAQGVDNYSMSVNRLLGVCDKDLHLLQVASAAGGKLFDSVYNSNCDMIIENEFYYHLMTKGTIGGRSLHNTLVLPFYTHPGEVIDPVITSLLLQAAQEEQRHKRSRLTVDCPLFKAPDAPESPVLQPLSKRRRHSWENLPEESDDDVPFSMGVPQFIPPGAAFASCTSPINEMI